MKIPFLSLYAGLGLALIAIVTPEPAAAQGATGVTAVSPSGQCPKGYHRGKPGHTRGVGSYATGENDPSLCYPEVSRPPSVYVRASRNTECASGYYVDAYPDWCTSTQAPRFVTTEEARGKPNRLTKPARDARCPIGWASSKDLKTCYTIVDNAPVARLSKGQACRPGELAEWDLWCTADYQTLSRKHAEGHAAQDFNQIYLFKMHNGGDYESMKCCLSAAAKAYYASIGEWKIERINGVDTFVDDDGNHLGAADDGPISPERAREIAANPRARGNVQRSVASSSSSDAQSTTCSSNGGSETGSAIGGMIGGDAGAVIGSMLGGFGKKKKKTAC